MVGKHRCSFPHGTRYFTTRLHKWVYMSHAPPLVSFPQAVRYLLAPDRPLPLPKHIPSLGSIDIPKFTRTEHPVHRNVDLNAGERETEVICYGIMIPSPIKHTKPPDDLKNLDSCVGSRGDFEIPTLEGAWVTPCNNEHQGR